MKNYYKILFLFSLFAIFNINAYSQKQAKIWYFGENAGLDFNKDTIFSIAPLDINNNDTVSVSLCMNMPVYKEIVIDCPSNQYFTYLNLPQNYSIASPVTWNDDTISSNIWQGDTIILDGGGRQGCYNFDITLNCDTANLIEVTDTIRYALMYACDTGECLKQVTSNSFTMTNHYYDCPDTNPSCIATTDIDVRRTTLGWTDATKTTPVTDTTEGIRLNAAYVFDRIRVEAKGIVVGNFFNNAHIQLTYSLPDSINILTFTDAQGFIISGTDTIGICNNLQPTILQTGINPTTFKLDFNFNTCIAQFVFQSNIIILTANFVVKEPDYLNSLNNIFSVFTARHYGINSLGDTLGCASQRQGFTFVNPYYFFKTIKHRRCEGEEVSLSWQLMNNCKDFHSEFRNIIRLHDTIQVFIPNERQYIDSTCYYEAFYEEEYLYNLMPVDSDTTPPDGDWLVFNKAWPISERGFNFSMNLQHENDFPAGGDVKYNISYTLYDYADTFYKVLKSEIIPLHFNSYENSALPGENVHLDLLPHATSLTSDTLVFDILVCNSDTNALWVALKNPDNVIDYLNVIEVTDSLNQDTLSLSPYEDGITKWFTVDSNRHSCKRYRVIAAYNSCDKDSIEIYTIYIDTTCLDSSAIIARALSRPSNKTFYIEPDKAEMQTNFTAVASDGIDECTPSAYEIELINSQFREITDIDVSIYVPDGFEIDSAGILYPSGSLFRALPPPGYIDSNLYGWTIDNVDTLIENYGLTGIDSIEKSRLKMIVWFVVDSAFDFNVDTPLITFNISGSPACNNFAQFTHQADPMLEKPLSADFNYTPVVLFEGDTVLFTSIDTTGVHLWLIYHEDAPISADTMNVSNPVYIFDSAGTYTVIHIISKDCNSGFASDTVVLQALNVSLKITPPQPADTCFSCASTGSCWTSDPHFAYDYNCTTGPPGYLYSNLTWVCKPADYGFGRYTITDNAAPWFPGLQCTDHSPSGNTNFFLGSISTKGGLRIQQNIKAGKSYNASVWVKNVMSLDCHPPGDMCLPSFAIYIIYSNSANIIAFRNRVSHQDGWVQLCGEYSAIDDQLIQIVIWAIDGEFSFSGYVFEYGDIHAGIDDFEVFEQSQLQVDITASDTVICSNDPSGITLTAWGGNTYLWSTGDTTSLIIVHPKKTTTYNVTATNADGCSATDSITTEVSVIKAVIDGPTTICRLPGNIFQYATLTASGGNDYLWSTGETTQSITVNQAGNYSVTVTDIYGCSDNCFAKITQSNQPPPQAKAGDDATINCGDAVLLGKPGPTKFLLFDWTPITELDNPNIRRPLASPVISTVYFLSVTSTKTGCVAQDDVKVTVLNPGCDNSGKSASPGINSADSTIRPIDNQYIISNEQIFIYPNPFNDNLIIDINIGEDKEIGINIHDLFGKTVYQLKPGILSAGNHLFEWNGKGMPGGVYLCRVTIGGTITNTRIVMIK